MIMKGTSIMYVVLWIVSLFLLPGSCQGQNAPVGRVAGPTVTCRIILIGNTGGGNSGNSDDSSSFSLTDFSLNCWSRDLNQAADNADPGVTVLFGASLRAHICESGVHVSGTSNSWRSVARPSTINPSEPDPGYDDWGIDFLDVVHLELVDSIVSGVPLSVHAPLLQCLNCSFVTVQNTTVQDLYYNPTDPARSILGFGAVRMTQLQGANLDGFRCRNVTGSKGWACIALELHRISQVEIQNSVFSNVAVGYYSQTQQPRRKALSGLHLLSRQQIDSVTSSVTTKQRLLTEGDTAQVDPGRTAMLSDCNLSGQTSTAGSQTSTAGSRWFPVSQQLLSCSTNDLNLDIQENIYPYDFGYGAILLGYYSDDQPCQSLKIGVLVENTVITNNAGDCGAGITVRGLDNKIVCRQPFDIQFANSTLLDNEACVVGGAIFFNHYVTASVTIKDGSMLSNNSAEFNGGGAAIYSSINTNLFIVDSEMSQNTAVNGDGAGIFVKASNMTSVNVRNSTSVNNTAAEGNGGAFCLESGSVVFTVTGQSQVEGNRAVNGKGGAICFLESYVQQGGLGCTLTWDAASTLSYNSAASAGGGVYVDADVVYVHLLGATQWVGNTAQDDGGALSLNLNDQLGDLSYVTVEGNSQVSGNRANNGGAFYVHGFVSMTMSYNCNISSNTAVFDGGAVFLTQLPVGMHLDSCTVANNKASRGSGGAFYLATMDMVFPVDVSSNPCPNCFFPDSISNVTAINTSFIGNMAEKADGGVFYISPHLSCCKDTTVNVIVRSSVFQGNSATGAGGALALYDASDAVSRIKITDSTFIRNSAGGVTGDFTASSNFGGALMIWREIFDYKSQPPVCQVYVEDTVFGDNNCNGGSGGAVMLIACGSEFRKCNYTGNHATLSGGAIASLQLARTSLTLGLAAQNISGRSDGLSYSTGDRLLLRRRSRRSLQNSDRLRYRRLLTFGPNVDEDHYVRYRRKVTELEMLDNQHFPDASWTADVFNCSFTSNAADLEFGGALYLFASSDLGRISIAESTFTRNKAVQQHGGAAFLAAVGSATRALVADSAFTNNTADIANAGALYLLLGANAYGSVVNTSLHGNTAAASAGGSIMDVRNHAELEIQNLTAYQNHALGGNAGALQVQAQANSSVSLTGCNFWQNSASGHAGALLLDGSCSSVVHIFNTSMERNEAGLSGGALYTSYASKPTLISGSSMFGSPNALDTAAAPCLNTSGLSHVSIYSVTMDSNVAGYQGGAAFLAPASTMTLTDVTMSNNSACGGGGSLAAQDCSRISLLQSIITSSHTAGTGGGMYLHNCRRVLLQSVALYGNKALLSGGGMTISGQGHQDDEQPGQDSNMTSYANNGVSWQYTSMILHGLQLASNEAIPSLDMSQSCPSNGTTTLGMKGTGGGLHIYGNVVGVLSQCNLSFPNEASFGTAFASAQRCFPSTRASQNVHDDLKQVDDTDEVDAWQATWDKLNDLAALQCWILQLSDTLLPPANDSWSDSGDTPSTTMHKLTIWMDDFLASALSVECSAVVTNLVDATATDLRPAQASARDRLTKSLARVRDSIDFSGVQITSFVINNTVRVTDEVKTMSEKRRQDLTAYVASCIDLAHNDASARADLLRDQPYIGLPATSIRLQLISGDGTSNEISFEEVVHISLEAGVPFNLTAQLYDMFDQKVTLDASSAWIHLQLVPQQSGISATGNMSLDFLANLDAGLNKSLTVPVVNGMATWTAVKAYAWPGYYYLQLTFSSDALAFVQVARLDQPVEVLPCAAGDTLDLTFFSYRPSLTGCQACPSGQYGLWQDVRPYLSNMTTDTNGFYVNDTSRIISHYLQTMNYTVRNLSYECSACPQNAHCLGGALLVPHLGYWHSAANSTQVHQCPNPTACGVDQTELFQFPDRLEALMAEWDSRTKMLTWCQLAWYSSIVPGMAVTAAYNNQTLQEVSDSYVLNRDFRSQTEGPDIASVKCLLFGLPAGNLDSYMQQQCRGGYTGNLCAACISGYYVDSDFNCKRCPGVTRTVVLGLISFFSSVVLVLFTTVTNLTEGFGMKKHQNRQQAEGEQAGEYAKHGHTDDIARSGTRVELGDVVKVIVLHLQYLIIVTRLSVDYPSIILRCRAVFSTVTGAENYIVYSPSCLQPTKDSGGQAFIQWLAGLLTPCAVVIMSMFVWTLRYLYPSRRKIAEVLLDHLRSACNSASRRMRAVLAYTKRPDVATTRLDSHFASGSVQDPTNTRPNYCNDAMSLLGSLPISLPQDGPPIVVAPPDVNQDGGIGRPRSDPEGKVGLSSVFKDVQVVAFEAADAHQEAHDGEARSTAAVPEGPEGPAEVTLGPAPLPTAASAALVIDLDELETGSPAKALEGIVSDKETGFAEKSVFQRFQLHGVSGVPEDALDRLSGMPSSILRSRDHLSPSGGLAPGYSGFLHSQTEGTRHRVVSGRPCNSPTQYYRRHPSYDTWRRTPKSLSHMGTTAHDVIKGAVHKLKTAVVNTQLSSHATFMSVDQAMNLREQLGVVLMAAVFILYPSWAYAALSTFACYPIDDGRGPFPEGQLATGKYGYWVRDMQMQCYSGVHLHAYVPVGVVAVIVFCLLPPLTSFLFVWRVRDRLNEAHVRKVYGFLYKRYKPRYIWWETVLQLETLILVTVEVLGRGLNVSYQALLLLAVFTVIALVNVSCAPLVSHLLVLMEFMSLGTLSLTITLSLYFTINDGLNSAAENTLAILIITLNVILMMFFLYIASRHFWPSAVRKVAPTAQAVLPKLSSLAVWPITAITGCFRALRSKAAAVDGKTDTNSLPPGEPASATSEPELLPYHWDRYSDECSNGTNTSVGNSDCGPPMPISRQNEFREIARASVTLEERASSSTAELVGANVPRSAAYVGIQLD